MTILTDGIMKLDGYDITEWITENGIKWTRNDVDGPNAGRNLNGTMIRDLVCTKIKMEVTCRDMEGAAFRRLLEVIVKEYVTVEYDDPLYGHVTKKMYSNNHSAQLAIIHQDETRMWKDITFPLIEV